MEHEIKNISGHVVDVINQQIVDATVSLKDGHIVSIESLPGLPTNAPYIMPGFVDAHIHIESTLMLPENFAALAVQQGTVAVVADPHEIANVLGIPGIDYMIENGHKVRFYFNFGAPSCVPSTSFETSGATLGAKEVTQLLQRNDIYGLAEVMNVPGVLNGDPELKAKLNAAILAKKPIDGHAPAVHGAQAQQYIEAGITTDHECTSLEEAVERSAMGMKILIREGSAACNFDTLSPMLANYPTMIMFCSDDKYADELEQGYINHLVRRAVKNGLPFWNVLRAACVNPVEHYHLKNGLLRKGDSADFIIVDNLKQFSILATYIEGEKVFDQQHGVLPALRLKTTPIKTTPTAYPNNFNAQPLTPADLRVSDHYDPHNGKLRDIKVMEVSDGSLYTRCMRITPHSDNNQIKTDPENDILKLVVYNRYRAAAPQMAFIKGFGIQHGAIASTIAHDSHNIIAVGCTDEALQKVINHLVKTHGGIAVYNDKQIFDLPLPVAGLMSPLPGKEVAAKHRQLKKQVAAMGCAFAAPFMALSFMALPVIPELKLTDKGLFDVTRFSFTQLFC